MSIDTSQDQIVVVDNPLPADVISVPEQEVVVVRDASSPDVIQTNTSDIVVIGDVDPMLISIVSEEDRTVVLQTDLLEGPPGTSGREVELGVDEGNSELQWRYQGEADWRTLITLSTGLVSTYVFIQNVPATQWIIDHNLGRFPGVTITDSAGDGVFGGVSYINTSRIILNFSSAFSGRAFLN